MSAIALAFLKKFWPQILGAVCFVVLVTVLGVWHHGKVKQTFNKGYASAEATYKPQLEHCGKIRDAAVDANKEMVAAIARLEALSKTQKEAMTELEQREIAAKLRGDRLMAQLAAKEKALRTELEKLRVQLNQPSPTPAAACAVADQILTELAKRPQ